jgi:hypothetical protein
MTEAPHVYKAITAVTAAMARDGISKARRNEQQGYQFRGIDELYNALSSVLAENHLCILPRVLERSVTERATRSGGVSTYVVLDVEFDLVSSVDGSKHTIRTMGEAMDSADKATNKAMSAAMKYACLMAFQIPTEGDNDADYKHPQKAAPRNAVPRERAPGALPRPAGTAPVGSAVNAEAWLEWALVHSNEMLQAKTAGELKAAFSTAWREADRRNAPDHIRASLEKAKNDLKSKFESDTRVVA